MQSAGFPGIERFIVKSAGNSRSNLILIVVDLSARSTVVLSVTTSCRCCITPFCPTASFRRILTRTQVANDIVSGGCFSGSFFSSGLPGSGFFSGSFLVGCGFFGSSFFSCGSFLGSRFFISRSRFFSRSLLGSSRFLRSIGSSFLLCFLSGFLRGFCFRLDRKSVV